MYLECIYSSCINGFRLGLKRNAEQVYDDSIGRFERSFLQGTPPQMGSTFGLGGEYDGSQIFGVRRRRDLRFIGPSMNNLVPGLNGVVPRKAGALTKWFEDQIDGSMVNSTSRMRGIPRKVLSVARKRGGFLDASEVCMEFNCGGFSRGTLGYLKCVNNKMHWKTIKKRLFELE